MDSYIYSESDLPHKFYRVHYPENRTTFSSQRWLYRYGQEQDFGANELSEFKRAIEKQFTWGCRDSLPFISLFSDREHAENWGLKEPGRGNRGSEENRSLNVINTAKMINANHFFKLSDLVEKLDLDIPEGAGQHIEGAFLCLHHIPLRQLSRVGNRLKSVKVILLFANMNRQASN
jgi:hypothetical protein